MQIARGLVYSIGVFHYRIDGYTLLTGIAADGTTEDRVLPFVNSNVGSAHLHPFVWHQQLYVVEIVHSRWVAIYKVLSSYELMMIAMERLNVSCGRILGIDTYSGELIRQHACIGDISTRLFGKIMPFVDVGSDGRLCFHMPDDGLLLIDMVAMKIECIAGSMTLDTFPIGSVYDSVRCVHYFVTAGPRCRYVALSRGIYKVEIPMITLGKKPYDMCACDGILAIEDIDNDYIAIYNIDDGSKREIPPLNGARDCTSCRLSFMRPNLLIVVYDGMRGDEGVSIMSYIDLITGDTYAVDIITTRDDELVCAGLYIAD